MLVENIIYAPLTWPGLGRPGGSCRRQQRDSDGPAPGGTATQAASAMMPVTQALQSGRSLTAFHCRPQAASDSESVAVRRQGSSRLGSQPGRVGRAPPPPSQQAGALCARACVQPTRRPGHRAPSHAPVERCAGRDGALLEQPPCHDYHYCCDRGGGGGGGGGAGVPERCTPGIRWE
jgi:hypothetical protein